MTVIPGADVGTMTLICNDCGMTEHTPELPHDPDVVWPVVSAASWSGSPFAVGPHLCPRCSVRPGPQRPAVTSRPRVAVYHMRVHSESDTMVIAPLTDIDAGTAGSLRGALEDAAEKHRHVLMDLHATEMIDSAGLGMLVRARQHARAHGSGLVLAAPSRYVRTVLHTMKLDAAFAIFDDTESALAELS